MKRLELQRLAKMMEPRQHIECSQYVWVVKGMALVSNGYWIAGWESDLITEEMVLTKELHLTARVPSIPAIQAHLPAKKLAGWPIETAQLFKLCAAIAPGASRAQLGILISIDWNSDGIPILSCETSASDTCFDPAALKQVLAIFPAEVVKNAKAFYNADSEMLVVSSDKYFAILPRLVP